MRKWLLLILLLVVFLESSCKKDDTPDTSGIVTIDNTSTLGPVTYYVYGFLFAEAKKVTTLDTPPPDITVESNGTNLYLDTKVNSYFYKSGEYNDAATAATAFDNLKSATVLQSDWAGLADPIRENQIWIFKSSTDHYAKFRIISTKTAPGQGRPYAECTFEWEYQPDGTLSFPGK